MSIGIALRQSDTTKRTITQTARNKELFAALNRLQSIAIHVNLTVTEEK